MMNQMFMLWNMVVAFILLVPTWAFWTKLPAVTSFIRRGTTPWQLCALSSHSFNGGGGEEEHADDYYASVNHPNGKQQQEIRQQLEHVLSLTPNNRQDAQQQQQQQRYGTILSSHAQQIKEMELHLLECLQESNQAIDTLVDVWMGEHGEQEARLLHQMESACSPGLKREEAQLRSLIEQYQGTWAEPMTRLAVLLFAKGRYEEATHWCHEVLCIKPWHFETGQLLVTLWLRRENLPQAVRVARMYTLPDLKEATNHKRRRAWVQRNYALLQQELQNARYASEQMHHDETIMVDEECHDEYCWA